jgi:hypothetical protein
MHREHSIGDLAAARRHTRAHSLESGREQIANLLLMLSIANPMPDCSQDSMPGWQRR